MNHRYSQRQALLPLRTPFRPSLLLRTRSLILHTSPVQAPVCRLQQIDAGSVSPECSRVAVRVPPGRGTVRQIMGGPPVCRRRVG